jgi:S-(hydroxymethyl)glutathione dehydrogenase / alcohol dehydrogenase
MRMKAAILSELGKPLVIDQVDVPDDLNVGQVLVKVLYSGICGSQLGEIDGKKGDDPYLPHLLGHEGSGKVVKTGPGVKFVRPGDTVVLHWRKGLGIESDCPKYKWKGQTLNAGFVTTFSEYAIVSENRLTVIPGNDVAMDILPLLGCAVTTGLGVVNNNAKVKIGESVVVLGAGGVGLNIIQGSDMCSAHPVVAVDIHANRLEMALKFGATHLIHMNQVSDLSATIRDIVGKKGADVVIDNTGNTDMINSAYSLVKPDGRVILVGVPKSGDHISVYSLDLHFGKVLTGSHGGETQPSIDIPRYLNLYKNKKINLDGLITDRFCLDDINIALDRMRSGQAAGRCMIEMHPST